MPIEMTAHRRYYDKGARKEYAVGATITVPDERAAARLERTHRAARIDPSPSPTDLPKAAMTATVAPEDETMDAPPEAEDTFVGEAAPEASADPRTDTRDIAQTGGRTGVAKPSRSSRQAPRPKKRS